MFSSKSGSYPRARLAAVAALCFLLVARAIAAPPALKMQTSGQTGLVSFLSTEDGRPIPVTVSGRASPTPQDFLLQYGGLFGVSDIAVQLLEESVDHDALGFTHTTYRQVHEGIRVFGGTLKVHQDSAGQVTAANGDFFPIPAKLTTRAVLTVGQAESIAAAAIEEGHPEVEQSQLVVIDTAWYGDPPSGARLAYHVVLSDGEAAIREAFFIDATDGRILDHWDMIHTARNRRIHDANGEPVLPGPLTRGEGQPAIAGNHDVNAAYDYYGDTYDFFFRGFGRDSIDGRGMAMVATVDSPIPGCPNAFWSGSLRQMVFCPGLVTDDIVGHELTHGITEFTAGLIYQNQSGQLNESFSDVFGEAIDLWNSNHAVANTNGATPPWPSHPTGPDGIFRANANIGRTDSCSPHIGYANGVRWLIGEDSPIGAIRDMWRPPCDQVTFCNAIDCITFFSPARANDPEWDCTRGFDNGGVHYGSGVPNHAFAMLTDGKTFNGYTVAGIGLIKTGAIWYRALTQYLTEVSDFEDAYAAFKQAGADLLGTTPNDPRTGLPSSDPITAEDLVGLDKALKAVEMNGAGRCGTELNILKTEEPTSCSGNELFFANFESGADTWEVNFVPDNHPMAFYLPTVYYWVVKSGLPQGRAGKAMYCAGGNIGDCFEQFESAKHVLSSPFINIPADAVAPQLSFEHYIKSEVGWDGGNVEFEILGVNRDVPLEDFVYNPYNSVLYRVFQFDEGVHTPVNPLEDKNAWSGTGGWATTTIRLPDDAIGRSIRIHFNFGKDGCGGADGWYVDDVRVFDCDCNTNGFPDQDDVASGTSLDCQSNGIPDECEVAVVDCNANGTPDDCDGGCGSGGGDGGGGGGPDQCPNDPAKTAPGQCGCGVADTDSDADGVPDCLDLCPNDTTVKKSGPGICGCGTADTDTDGDGVPDCNDKCPNARDADTDGDGLLDCNDLCPGDPAKSAPGECGCGQPEGDGDGDGTPDCRDLCPEDPRKGGPGACGCGTPDDDSDRDGVADCFDNSPGGLPVALLIDGPASILVGENGQFAALIQYAGGETEDVTDEVSWRILDTVLASNSAGLFTRDSISAAGLLEVSNERSQPTRLALIATFSEGGTTLEASRLIAVVFPEEEAPQPEPQNENSNTSGGGSGSGSGGSVRTPCGAGLLVPMLVAIGIAGLLRPAHRRTRRG